MTERANTPPRRHPLGGAFRNPEPPVKVEAAGRRGRAEGPRGPAPRDPCRVERPALTGGGGFPPSRAGGGDGCAGVGEADRGPDHVIPAPVCPKCWSALGAVQQDWTWCIR